MDPSSVGSPSMGVSIAFFATSLGVCALTSFLETSITTVRLFKLKEFAQTNDRYKTLLGLLERSNNRVLTTILIAKNLADVSAATFGASFTERLFNFLPNALNIWLGITLITALVLIFGEIIPKLFARSYGDRFFSSTLWLTNIIYYTLYPVVNFFVPIGNFILGKTMGGKPVNSSHPVTSEKELQFLIEYITKEGYMDREKTTMLKSIFELSRKTVRDIMVPATSIVSINVTTGIKEAFDFFIRYQFSRLPVYETTPDNVIGMIYLKDLFPLIAQSQKKNLREILRSIIFVPESTRVNKLLKQFRIQNMHLAIVINEHGSILGLVTLEDIVEEIVGEIHDEYELISEKVIPLKPGTWLIDASIELKELSTTLDISFETESANTLGGFLNEQFQYLPKKGERLNYKDFNFQVQQAGAKRVLQVLAYKEKNMGL